MRKIAPLLAVLLIIATAPSAHGEDSDLAGLFNSRGLKGTIVISSLDGTRVFIHNEERARERFAPASTFKIPNTLIALEEGAVADGMEVIKWDGKDRGLSAWNKDQTLRTAFPSSCVWFYQELAGRVGQDKYERYLAGMKYGNERAGPELATFWLQGDLTISAVEQISFLKKVYTREFAFRQSSYELLEEIMIVEKTPSFTIRAKTGWAPRAASPVGWFTGYIERNGEVWFFATNLEITKPEDTRFRQEITMEALKLKGII